MSDCCLSNRSLRMPFNCFQSNWLPYTTTSSALCLGIAKPYSMVSFGRRRKPAILRRFVEGFNTISFHLLQWLSISSMLFTKYYSMDSASCIRLLLQLHAIQERFLAVWEERVGRGQVNALLKLHYPFYA